MSNPNKLYLFSGLALEYLDIFRQTLAYILVKLSLVPKEDKDRNRHNSIPRVKISNPKTVWRAYSGACLDRISYLSTMTLIVVSLMNVVFSNYSGHAYCNLLHTLIYYKGNISILSF